MIASEQGGRGAEEHRGRSAFLDAEVERAMHRLLELGHVQAKHNEFNAEEKRLHYLTAGEGESLVMLHGASGGAANWYRLIGPLSRHFRVIAFDLPGFGLSDAIEPEPPLGQQVAALIAKALGAARIEPQHIVGTSFGGLVAARLAQLTQPKSVILLNPAGLWREATFKLKLACTPVFQKLALKQTRPGARWALRNILTSRRLEAEHEKALVDYIYWAAARADLSKLARAYSLFGGLRGQYEVLTEQELRALGKRLLVIWGASDRFLPSPQRRLAAVLAAGAQLHMIPGVGHSPNWEAPDELLAVIFGFLGIDE